MPGWLRNKTSFEKMLMAPMVSHITNSTPDSPGYS